MQMTNDERADWESLLERLQGWAEDLESAIGYAEKHAQHAATRVTMAMDLVRIRREAVKAGMVKTGDGKDLDHKMPLSKGGSNKLSNVRVTSPSDNRSFPRKKDGSMK